MRNSIILVLLLLLTPPTFATLNLFACEPEWGALTKELGGEQVEIFVATTGKQDPHVIQARPSLIAKMRRADLLVCTGAELEIGWLPVLTRQAANPKVQPGQNGYFMATDFVTLLEKPSRLDRQEGDIHVAGNPHIQMDPHRLAQVAKALSARLAVLDTAHSGYYQTRYQDFANRWQQAITRWELQALPLRKIPIVAHHKGWIYLEAWLGLQELVTLEPKPGISPSSGHLAEVLTTLQRTPAKMVIYAAYEESRPSQWLSERAHIPVVELPFTVGGTVESQDLFSLFDDTLRRLLGAVR